MFVLSDFDGVAWLHCAAFDNAGQLPALAVKPFGQVVIYACDVATGDAGFNDFQQRSTYAELNAWFQRIQFDVFCE